MRGNNMEDQILTSIQVTANNIYFDFLKRSQYYDSHFGICYILCMH